MDKELDLYTTTGTCLALNGVYIWKVILKLLILRCHVIYKVPNWINDLFQTDFRIRIPQSGDYEIASLHGSSLEAPSYIQFSFFIEFENELHLMEIWNTLSTDTCSPLTPPGIETTDSWCMVSKSAPLNRVSSSQFRMDRQALR